MISNFTHDTMFRNRLAGLEFLITIVIINVTTFDLLHNARRAPIYFSSTKESFKKTG